MHDYPNYSNIQVFMASHDSSIALHCHTSSVDIIAPALPWTNFTLPKDNANTSYTIRHYNSRTRTVELPTAPPPSIIQPRDYQRKWSQKLNYDAGSNVTPPFTPLTHDHATPPLLLRPHHGGKLSLSAADTWKIFSIRSVLEIFRSTPETHENFAHLCLLPNRWWLTEGQDQSQLSTFYSSSWLAQRWPTRAYQKWRKEIENRK